MVAPANTRVLITIPKNLKSKIEERAKNENRSANNLIITILLKEFGVIGEE